MKLRLDPLSMILGAIILATLGNITGGNEINHGTGEIGGWVDQ